nr:MAG TPA: hypothetical protein [Caudoviricetes sp.]
MNQLANEKIQKLTNKRVINPCGINNGNIVYMNYA